MKLLSNLVNIKKMDRKKNIPELLNYLEDKKANVRYSAFVALATESSLEPEVMSKLKKLVNDPDPMVKTVATLRFAGLGDKSLAKNLMEIIGQGSRDTKIELLQILAGRGVVKDETILSLIVEALKDKNEVVRQQAIVTAAATKSRHMMPYLAEFLHEKHHELRIRAAGALYEIGGADSVDYLIAFLGDDNTAVHNAARSLLANIKSETVKNAIDNAEFMVFIKKMHDKEPIRKETAKKIGEEKIKEALPLLHRACGDKYKEVRLEVLKSIAIFKNRSSVEFVARMLNDKYHDVRIEAIHTLAKINSADAIKAVELALDDDSKQVRDAAETVLKKNKKASK